MAYLEIYAGQQSGQQLNLGNTASLGRHTDNDFIINDSRVSRYHARIVRRREQFFLYDLSSSNGTFIGDLQLASDTPYELMDGDEVRIGSTCIIFHLYRFLSSSSEMPRPTEWWANVPRHTSQAS